MSDTIEGRTYACRNGSCYACPSTSDEWCTCGCTCHESSKHAEVVRED